jgi:hypothetical protein
MPIEYQIDLKHRFLRTTATGDLNSRELEDYFDRLLADPDFSPDMPGLIDLRGLTDAPEIEEVRRLGSVAQRKAVDRIPGRRALLVADDLLFGTMRMFEVYSHGGPFKYRTFRDEVESLRWLGLV